MAHYQTHHNRRSGACVGTLESVSKDVFDDTKAMFVEWTDLDASFIDLVIASDFLGVINWFQLQQDLV